MIYAVYRDDGGRGCGGQVVSFTGPRVNLVRFFNLAEFLNASDSLRENMGSRRNPRFVEVFSDDENDGMYKALDYNPNKN